MILRLQVPFRAQAAAKEGRCDFAVHCEWGEACKPLTYTAYTLSFPTPRTWTWNTPALNSSDRIITWKVLQRFSFGGFLEKHCGGS